MTKRAQDLDGTVERALTVVGTSGLCNRLKVLLSGRVIAQATGRVFAMRWSTGSTGCLFDRLFQNQWSVSADVPVDEHSLIDLATRPWRNLPDLTQAQNDWLFVHHYDWLIRPGRYPQHAALEKRCALLVQELVPVAVLQERIDAFRAYSFRPQMIGVHLRRGDFIVSRPDVVDNLALALEAVDRWLDESPDAGILLSTDDGAPDPFNQSRLPYEGVLERFVQRFGERVVTPRPRTLDRRQPEAIEDALVDLWLLRSTDWFVGTQGSSFSEMAVLGRGVPTVLTGAPTREYHKSGPPAQAYRSVWHIFPD